MVKVIREQLICWGYCLQYSRLWWKQWEPILLVPGTHKHVHSVWAETKHKVRLSDVCQGHCSQDPTQSCRWSGLYFLNVSFDNKLWCKGVKILSEGYKLVWNILYINYNHIYYLWFKLSMYIGFLLTHLHNWMHVISCIPALLYTHGRQDIWQCVWTHGCEHSD